MLVNRAVTNHSQRVHDLTALITLVIFLAILVNIDLQPLRKGINYRRTYTMKSTRYLVSATAELATGMKHRKYDFYGRKSCFFLDSNWDSTSIINNSNRIVGIDDHIDLCTISSQSLVNGVVNDLIYQMMETSG